MAWGLLIVFVGILFASQIPCQLLAWNLLGRIGIGFAICKMYASRPAD
jgi:hypothetical protein